MFLLPALKLPDVFAPAPKPSPLKLEMPPKPPDQAVVPAPPPPPEPEEQQEVGKGPDQEALPSVAPTKQGEPAKAIEIPKAADATKSVEPMAEKEPPSYPYSIYLGSFRSEDVLQRALEAYREKGLLPYPARVDLGQKGVWFRVFSGHFETREKAAAFIRERRIADGETRNTRFAVLLGRYSSRREAQETLGPLIGRGCHPYIIEENAASFRVYTGAFYRDEDAKAELAWLASKGITGRIVKR
jgi:hypothetical protein